MEELDLLKKDWKKQDVSQPKLSYNDIYKMLWKKSSSVVKWIFYISIIELAFGLVIGVIMHTVKFENSTEMPVWLNWFSYFGTAIIIYFIYKFFINYRKISVTSSVKELMQKIISTRQTVKHYIMFNLAFLAIVIFITLPLEFIQQAGGMDTFVAEATVSKYLLLAVITIVTACVCVAVFYGIYYLIYGLLINKLKKNYTELEQLNL